MECNTLLWGLFGILAMFLCGYPPDKRRKIILDDKFEFLRARVQDIREIFLRVHRGKKQNLDEDLDDWIDEAHELVRKTECLIGQVGGWMGFFISAKVNKLIDDLDVHDKKGGELLMRAMSEVRVSGRHYLPVKEVGQSASETLEQLEHLLQDDGVRRIAVCGDKGVGKTFLMKHLYNCALNEVEKFDHVFWVTLQDQSTVKQVQDAIAKAVNCDLNSDDALNVTVATVE